MQKKGAISVNYLDTSSGFRVVLGRAYCGLTGGFLLLRNFSVVISVSPQVCFILVLLRCSYANRTSKCFRNQGRTKAEG